MVVPAFGGDDSGIRDSGGGEICHPLPEYHIPEHRDAYNTGAVYGGGAADSNTGGTAVVVILGYGPGGREGGDRENIGGVGGGFGGGDGGVGGRGGSGYQDGILTRMVICSN